MGRGWWIRVGVGVTAAATAFSKVSQPRSKDGWGWSFSVVRDHPMHHKVFSSIPGCYLPVFMVPPPLTVGNQKCLQTSQMPPGMTLPVVENCFVGFFPVFFFIVMIYLDFN